MIKIGQVVEVVSYEKTIEFSGRESQYRVGDQFMVSFISKNTRGYGRILSDDDCNFIHEDDVRYEFEVSNDHLGNQKECSKIGNSL